MSNKLYIGNLDYSVSSGELQDFLASKWKVVECKVIEGKGFGFVTFEDSEAANSAKDALDGQEFKGRKLKIDNARENAGGGSRGGGGGGSRGGSGGGRNGGGGGGFGFKKRY